MYFANIVIVFLVLYFCLMLIMIKMSPQLAMLLINS